MSQLQVGDKITVTTKAGAVYTGTYCYLRGGYIGLSEDRLAISRQNIAKIVINRRK